MPKKKQEFLDEMTYHLDDDSSDEDDSDDESGSGSDDDSGSGSDDESGSDSGSGSDSDDDDSDESGSGSDDSDDSSSKKKKKKKGKDDEKKEEEDVNTIYKIQQISSKLSWLLDDLHKTFKPKSVPKIDPKNVFPYPYQPVPQQSPSKLKDNYKYNHQYIKDIQHLNDNHDEDDPKIHFATHNKSPISSPIRHGNEVDRGVGGHYIFPSYAAPPSKNEINKLYGNYSDKERAKIAQNRRKERERKSLNLFARKSRKNMNAWQDDNFSDRFMSASNQRRNASKRGLFNKNRDYHEFDETSMPHTFDELYQHYDEQKRMIEQKQNKMKRMKDKLYWFKKNSSSNSNKLSKIENQKLKIAEKKPLMKQNKNEKNQKLFNGHNLKETENKLLSKAAQILLGNNNESRSSGKEYGVICPDSPDSLQEKILNIASDGDGDEEDENRLPTFV